MGEWAIITARRQAGSLAQLAVESNELQDWEERPSAAPAGIAVGTTLANGWTVTSVRIRNDVVASYTATKTDPNGKVHTQTRYFSGPNYEAYDDPDYHGRGPIQLTNLPNYEAVSKALGLGTELVDAPEELSDRSKPLIGLRAAAAFWVALRDSNHVADKADLSKVASLVSINAQLTVKVRGNGALKDMANVQRRFTYYFDALDILLPEKKS
jgi:predicted chitinase